MKMERMFVVSSGKIATYPKITILIGMVLVGCFAIGFAWFKVENRTVKLFVPQYSQGMKDLNKADKYYRLKVREEIIIIVPQAGQKLLSSQCFKDALKIHKAVVNLPSYSELCATLSGRKANSSASCMLINPLELFNFEDKNLINISSKLDQESVCPSPLIMRNGRPSCQNMNRMFGNQKKNMSNISDAQAMRIVYYLRDTDTDKDYDKVIRWDAAFIDTVSSSKKNMTCAKILYASERSLDDAIDDSSSSDIR
jgi:hypothetical protein